MLKDHFYFCIEIHKILIVKETEITPINRPVFVTILEMTMAIDIDVAGALARISSNFNSSENFLYYVQNCE